MRNAITSLIELAGLGLIVAGFSLVSWPLAVVAAGVALIVIGLVQA
jgi:hypothetical protein